jgi:hypothetical protein
MACAVQSRRFPVTAELKAPADAGRQDGAPAAVEEPMLPVPAERFLTEPVHAR